MICAGRPRAAWPGLAFLRTSLRPCSTIKSGTIKGVAKVYNRYTYAAEKRQALDAWARRLEAIVTGAGNSNVIELSRAKV